MLRYRSNLKPTGRRLRSEMTECERLLWSRLRRKQLHGVQFYRQKPIGNYIVAFMPLQPDWWWRWMARSIKTVSTLRTTPTGMSH